MHYVRYIVVEEGEGYEIHVVQPGQSLYGIGQVLVVPIYGSFYWVQPGDLFLHPVHVIITNYRLNKNPLQMLISLIKIAPHLFSFR